MRENIDADRNVNMKTKKSKIKKSLKDNANLISTLIMNMIFGIDMWVFPSRYHDSEIEGLVFYNTLMLIALMRRIIKDKDKTDNAQVTALDNTKMEENLQK